MASFNFNYPNSLYSPPPVRDSRPQDQQPQQRITPSRSPWSISPHNSAEQLALTLPIVTPGDLAEDQYLYSRLESPSDFLTRPSTFTPTQSRQLPQLQSRTQQDISPWQISDSPDPFADIDFDTQSEERSPPADLPLTTRSSSIVDLTEPISTAMDRTHSKRKSGGSQPDTPLKRQKPNSSPKKSTGVTIEEVDLAEVDDDSQYSEFKKKSQAEIFRQQQQDEADKPQKLSTFQCIICLDQPTDLTVTHCGHMFCSFCLHEALHAATTKKACPVCRQPIVMPKPGNTKQSSKSFWPLEMKLMTAKKKGKQVVR